MSKLRAPRAEWPASTAMRNTDFICKVSSLSLSFSLSLFLISSHSDDLENCNAELSRMQFLASSDKRPAAIAGRIYILIKIKSPGEPYELPNDPRKRVISG